MKNIVKRLLSIVLTLAMLVSLVSVPAYAEAEKEIELSIAFTSDGNSENRISSVSAGDEFRMWVNFSGNPSALAESVQAYDLLISYDADKISFPSGILSIVAGCTEPTLNPVFDEGIAYAGWANYNGIAKGGVIQTEGNLFAIDAKAEADISREDLLAIEFIDEADNGSKQQYTQLTDGSGNKFALVQIPDVDEEEVEPIEIMPDDFMLDLDGEYIYSAEAYTPAVVTDLTSDDYDVEYKNNINAGEATVVITGKGNYTGTVELVFQILPAPIEDEEIIIDLEDKEYTGDRITVDIDTDLSVNDYTVSYENNINVGTATVTITGQGNFTGEIVENFTICAKEIKKTDFIFDLEDKFYTGEAIEPEVESELSDAYYEVSYEDNVEIGTATIVVVGKVNYQGRITETFEIVEEPEEIIPVKSLKFATTKVTIYTSNDYDLGASLEVEPLDHNDTIEWTSSNEEIATVEDGIVTAYAAGSVKITARAVEGDKSAVCSVTVVRSPEWIDVEGVSAIALGKTVTFKATPYYYDEAKDKDVKTKDVISWRSDDEGIATVSKGKVKGIAAGTTTIYAYIEGTDLEEAIEVSVVVPVKSMKLATTKLTTYEDCEYDLGEQLTIVPLDHNDTIVWTSSKEEVVSVDENGVITAHAMGSAKITAKAVAGGKSVTCTVTVSRMPEWIDLEGVEAIAQGKSVSFKAAAYYYDEAKDKDVKTKDVISWRSDDEGIATVSKGKVKGIAAGTTTIYAYIEGTDLEEAIEVSVVVPVKSMKLATTKLTTYEDCEYDLGEQLTIAPLDHNDTIVWTSSKEEVVSVDENGVITAHAMGSAKITAKAVAGGKSVTCTVTVSRMPEWIELEGVEAIAQGKSVSFKAAAYYYDEAKDKDVKTKDVISWRSDDEGIATVSKGKVKGIAAGTTTIYAYIEGTDLEEAIEVTVVIPAKTLKFSSSKMTANVGDIIDMSEYLTVTPEENTDMLTWTSSKESVAIVDEDGRVEIVGEGSAKITAKAVAGGKSAYVTITANE